MSVWLDLIEGEYIEMYQYGDCEIKRGALQLGSDCSNCTDVH